jgi:hypothetical protein
VYVRDTEVIPSATYFAHSQCDFVSSIVLSAGNEATTWKWGDTTGDGTANVIDVARDVDCVKQVYPPGSPFYRPCNLWDCNVDGVVSALDIAKAVDAAKGIPFSCPAVCPE